MVSAQSPVSPSPRSDADLRVVCESIPHIVWVADCEGRIESVNRRAVALMRLIADGRVTGSRPIASEVSA